VTASLYVYFKAPADADVATPVATMQEALARESGVRGRLLRRRDDPTTWMEIYEDIGDFAQFEALLAAAVSRHGLEGLLRPGERRHAERFVTP
jgi:hypothetical protein